MVAGRPGVMKSPALAETLKPLHRLQDEADSAFHAALRDYEVNAELREMGSKLARDKAKKILKNSEVDARRLLDPGSVPAS
jgi:putative DNA primase/helicase